MVCIDVVGSLSTPCWTIDIHVPGTLDLTVVDGWRWSMLSTPNVVNTYFLVGCGTTTHVSFQCAMSELAESVLLVWNCEYNIQILEKCNASIAALLPDFQMNFNRSVY